MSQANESRKRKSTQPEEHSKSKRARDTEISDSQIANSNEESAGKVLKIFMRNFMCHDSMEIHLNKNVNFIVGRNGSGKSAILTALTVGLGARANTTNRGASMKEFIKKGRLNATVEISLTNDGINAYNQEIYGNVITVCRTIGTSSTYRIKDCLGKTISTRKSELDNILRTLNIQVDNPICILNQDVSRSFLIVSDASKKYQLFMKATQLDVILQKYKDSQIDTDDAQKNLKDAKEYLEQTENQIESLKKKLETLDSLESDKEECKQMMIEVMWAKVISEERFLHKLQARLKTANENLENLLSVEETKESREKELNVQIKEIQDKIAEEEDNNKEKKSEFEKLKGELDAVKSRYTSKVKDVNNLNTVIQRKKSDILQLQGAVQKLERESNEAEANKHKAQIAYENLKRNLEDIDAIIQAKQIEKRHLENDKMCVEQERYSLKSTLDNSRYTYNKIQKQLIGIKQQSDQAMTVYGPNMPRLIKRIEEEYAKGNFKEKPRGPIGAYIKVKEKDWIPAVENFLGGTIRSFCTDNERDAKLLSLIMKEVFHGERTPQIISSTFYNRVHDTSKNGCYAQNYCNMLQAMEISDPVVTNCLIDQREIECILLIPTNKEACTIMSQRNLVPRNCKRAITQTADLYFPDPNYRTYGGKRGLKARFLQVSADQAIQTLTEEMNTAFKTMEKAEAQFNAILERIRCNETECHNVSKFINENMARQRELKIKIEKMEDETNSNSLDELSVLTNDLREIQEKLKQDEERTEILKQEVDTIKNELEVKSVEWKRSREELQNFDMKLLPYKQDIRKLQDIKESLHFNTKKASDTIKKAKAEIQQAEANVQKHERVVNKVIMDSEKRGPRIETKRSVKELEDKIDKLKVHILTVEKHCSPKEEVEADLAETNAKYDKIVETVNRLNENIEKQLERLKIRKKLYASLRNQIGQKVQHAFEKILSLRKYKGTIYIDHKQLTLELEVSPANDSQRKTNDAKTLSGGERSYSTVAFILALWDCTGLPFYFLDEFDVFMDKINRRVIMDILLEHTKLYPQRQFGFLTPLDTSHIFADQYVSIHQLAPPERQSETQND